MQNIDFLCRRRPIAGRRRRRESKWKDQGTRQGLWTGPHERASIKVYLPRKKEGAPVPRLKILDGEGGWSEGPGANAWISPVN